MSWPLAFGLVPLLPLDTWLWLDQQARICLLLRKDIWLSLCMTQALTQEQVWKWIATLPGTGCTRDIPVPPGDEHYVLDKSLDEVYFALQ